MNLSLLHTSHVRGPGQVTDVFSSLKQGRDPSPYGAASRTGMERLLLEHPGQDTWSRNVSSISVVPISHSMFRG